MIVQAGGSEKGGRAYASRCADSIIASATTVDQMTEYRDDVRARAVGHGRKADDVKVLFLISPILGETHQHAVARKEKMIADAAADPRFRSPGWGGTRPTSTSRSSTSTSPIRELADQMITNGHQSSLAAFVRQNLDRTLREVASNSAYGAGQRVEFLGTPAEVAEQMGEVMADVGGDGFLITQDVLTRRSISEITDGLVPELQKRGLTRERYRYEMFRDNLLEF